MRKTQAILIVKISILFLSIVPYFLNAQTPISQSYISKVVPNSPNAAALAKYGDIPVSYYSGVPNIDIPIYNIQCGEIQIPISLSYHAGGIRLSEDAGWTGLGWTLNAGGAVTRAIYDKDDLNSSYFSNLSLPRMDKRPTSLFNIMTTVTGDDKLYTTDGTVYDWFPVFGNGNPAGEDLQADIFNFNFASRSGKFAITRTGEILFNKRVDLVVESYSQTGLTLIDENGIKYMFGNSEWTEHQGANAATAWYLTKIKSPQKDSVVFNYETGWVSQVPTRSEASRHAGGCEMEPYSITISARSTQVQYLVSIVYKNNRVELEYENGREDTSDGIGKKLVAVKVKLNNETLPTKQFNFHYSYFNPTSNSFLQKRLRLDKVVEAGKNGSTLSPYEFLYLEGSGSSALTAKNSLSIDHWGYYNGAANSTLLPKFMGRVFQSFAGTLSNSILLDLDGADRSVNPTYSKLFTLSEIKYPSGGRTEFEYESNNFNLKKSSKDSVLRTERMLVYTSADIMKSQSATGTVDLRNVYGNVKMVVNFRCAASDNCASVRGFSTDRVYFEALGQRVDISGDLVTCQSSVCTRTIENIAVAPGTYPWTVHIDPTIVGLQEVKVMLWWYEDVEFQPQGNPRNLPCGGIRVKTIKNYDERNAFVSGKKLEYSYTTDVDNDGILETISYGRRMVEPSYTRYETLFNYMDQAKIVKERCFAFARYSNSLTASSSGNIVGYDKVIEYPINNTGQALNGRTEYEFYNQSEPVFYYFQEPQSTFRLNARLVGLRTTGNPLSGTQASTTVFNAGNTAVQKQKSYYSVKDTKEIYDLAWETIPTAGDGGDTYGTCVVPSFRSDKVLLDSSYLEVDGLRNTTRYYYDNASHIQVTRTVTTRSDGASIQTNTYYPLDNISGLTAQATTAKTALTNAHIITPVLQSEVNENGRVKLVRTNYKVFAHGVPLPESVETRSGAGSLDIRFKYFAYDANSNLLTQSASQNAETSYVWGYNGEYVIAEVKNAKSTEIFYTGFEDDGNSSDGYTGSKSRTGGFTKVLTGLTSNKTYKLTYRQKGTTAWTLFEQTVALNASTTTYTISLTGQVDDVRFYPIDAVITTYAYAYGIGLSSMTDPNNLTTYYEYDDLSRLKFLRNDKKEILKKYSYNYFIR
jgi:hypothetical protein